MLISDMIYKIHKRIIHINFSPNFRHSLYDPDTPEQSLFTDVAQCQL